MKYALIITFVAGILIYLWAIFFNTIPAGLTLFLWGSIALKCVLITLLLTWQNTSPSTYYLFGWYVIFFKHYATDPYYRWLWVERSAITGEIRIEWRRTFKILITQLPF